ncbi:unnamed protein product [Auanema sp. JU1783]|nr:unnamed protein product [Auanema sp. JU1783]
MKKYDASSNISPCESSSSSDEENDSHAELDLDDKNVLSYFSVVSNYIWKNSRKASYASGTDSWVPTDPNEVVEVPTAIVTRYKKVYPLIGEEDLNSNGAFYVMSADESRKEEEEEEEEVEEELEPNAMNNEITTEEKEIFKPPLNHLVFRFWTGTKDNVRLLSLFRSRKVTDVIALCERCRESRSLFRCSLKYSSSRAEFVKKLLVILQEHLLWKPIHIAAVLGLEEFFKERKRKVRGQMHILSQPEGMTPLIIAVQHNHMSLVNYLVTECCEDLKIDSRNHNNVLHYAATASAEMVKLLMDSGKCDNLINATNNDGSTPFYLAVMGGNPFCAKALRSYGGLLRVPGSLKNVSPLLEAMKKPKMDVASLQAIFEAYPDSLKDSESLTGNTALHVVSFKKTLLALLDLKSEELHLDVRNSLMQTPLHVYILRSDLSLIMAIAAYNVDINAKDNNGNSPLHLAVSNLNLEIVKALLCLGAEPNIINNHKESPRHLAAKFKNNDIAMEIVRCLIICGASSCPQGFVGCTTFCVHRDNFVPEPKICDSDSESSVCRKLSKLAVDSQSATSAYEYEVDPDRGGKQDQTYHDSNPIRNFPQQQAIRAVMERLKEFQKKEDVNLMNVLSLDGGGIRGLVSTQILICLQRYLDSPVFSYFDWVAGTSTGTLIASAIMTGKSLREIQKVYLRFKDELFDSWTRPYSSIALEEFMKKCIGGDVKLSDIKYPRFFFTTVRADTFPVQLELLRNYRLPLTDEENNELGFHDPAEIPLWKAARRSSAAPTYFSASEGKFIDGGMVSNNPTLDLLSEIHFYKSTCAFKKIESNVDVGCVVSVGTGITPVYPVDPSVFEMSDMFGLLRGIKNLSLMVLDQATATEGAPIARSRSWCHALNRPYFRLNSPLFKDIVLDASDDSDLVEMMWDTVLYCHTHRKDLIELAQVLKAIGTNKYRKKKMNSTSN